MNPSRLKKYLLNVMLALGLGSTAACSYIKGEHDPFSDDWHDCGEKFRKQFKQENPAPNATFHLREYEAGTGRCMIGKGHTAALEDTEEAEADIKACAPNGKPPEAVDMTRCDSSSPAREAFEKCLLEKWDEHITQRQNIKERTPQKNSVDPIPTAYNNKPPIKKLHPHKHKPR